MARNTGHWYDQDFIGPSDQALMQQRQQKMLASQETTARRHADVRAEIAKERAESESLDVLMAERRGKPTRLQQIVLNLASPNVTASARGVMDALFMDTYERTRSPRPRRLPAPVLVEGLTKSVATWVRDVVCDGSIDFGFTDKTTTICTDPEAFTERLETMPRQLRYVPAMRSWMQGVLAQEAEVTRQYWADKVEAADTELRAVVLAEIREEAAQAAEAGPDQYDPSADINARAHSDMKRAQRFAPTTPHPTPEQLFTKFAGERALTHDHGDDVELYFVGGLAAALGRSIRSLERWQDRKQLPAFRYWNGDLDGKHQWLVTRDEFIGLVRISQECGMQWKLKGNKSKRKVGNTNFPQRAFELWAKLSPSA